MDYKEKDFTNNLYNYDSQYIKKNAIQSGIQ